MTGLQIAMSREIFGWPLYSLVMATGQVCWVCDTVLDPNNHFTFSDAECHELPNHSPVWSKLAE